MAEKLQMDFVAANELEFENGRTTGKVAIPLGWEKIGCFCKISVCKRYHLEKFAGEYNVPVENTMAVGDTKSDICMIQRAGVGIAFMPKDEYVSKATNKVVQDPDLLQVLEYAP